MKIFYLDNLTKTAVQSDLNPWDFKTDAVISQQIRHDKTSRQAWYSDINTRHNYYSFFEGVNPAARVNTKSNPPALIHGFGADYDTVIADETIASRIAMMKVKPAYVETSLGGHRRLVWLLEKPIVCGDYDFAVFIQTEAMKWLQLSCLPLLDEPCFLAPERLLCNGLIWEKVGNAAPIKATVSQAFFVECARKFNFKPKDACTIPLTLIEKELRAKYPRMADWPEAFDYEAPGPSFWIEGSLSPKSAIVKKEGMFTFAGHATKPFYSWSELLGASFVKEFGDNQMGTATQGIYYDGKSFWVKSPSLNCMVPVDKPVLMNDLKCQAFISTKPDKDGVSQMEKVMSHICTWNRIKCAAPVMFRPAGVVNVGGDKVLNTLTQSRVLPPADEPAIWGPGGNMPFISLVFDNLFEPHSQLRHFLSWFSHFYRNSHAGTPKSGQAVFMAGGPGMGKTLVNTKIIGGLFSGCGNGAKYVTGQDQFGGEVFGYGIISIDDETVSSSDTQRTKMEAIVKQLVANPIQRVRVMYQMPMLTEWLGRLLVSCNFDMVSLRVLPSLSEGMREKVNFYRVAEKGDRPALVYPTQDEITAILTRELPYLARFLLDFEIPAEFLADARFGIRAYHDVTLQEAARQSTKTATFYEMLVTTLDNYFTENPTVTEYCNTTTGIHRFIITNPYNQELLRALRVEQVGRYLEQVQREGLLPCYTKTVGGNLRSWVFPRFAALNLSPTPNEHNFSNRPATA